MARWFLILAALLLTNYGCRSSRDDRALANKIGERVNSPSGQFQALLAKNPEDSGSVASALPKITNRDGTIVYSAHPPYSTRPGVALLWERKVDVLWILSADVGNSTVRRIDGTWTKGPGSNPPPEVKKWLS